MHIPEKGRFLELAQQYNLIPVFREISADLETPVSAFLKTARGPYSFLLESVEGGERLARYSFIGTEPEHVIRTGPGEPDGEIDPLIAVKERLDAVRYAPIDGLPERFHGGAVGYISYDAIRYFEPRVPALSGEGTGIPESIHMLTDGMLVFDHVKHNILVLAHADVSTGDPSEAYDRARGKVEELIERLEGPLPPNAYIRSPGRWIRSEDGALDYESSAGEIATGGSPSLPNMTRERYEAMVEEGKKAIFDGEVIQVVLSQRMERKTSAPPFDIYRSLRAINPSPYMFYLDMGDFQIVGASPELLVRAVDGEVAVHPIAGTRPRGETPEEDARLAEELRNDEKEKAEHVMLLDLGRNDVGRVAVPGTVKVNQMMDVEYYSHVMHLVSDVTGKLDDRYDAFDVLRAGFPAGTVSGAPKVRAMELIAELEPDKRGAYAGAIGYFSYHGSMDTCIGIRTIVMKDGVAHLQAGGGVVADSTPAGEFDESLHKMGALQKAIDGAEAARRA
ncbi:MAG: anthranilate synthase component I [Chloroflexi bacterium]|nr:anthranilate synthase component I [Chloroflexota bacterium]